MWTLAEVAELVGGRVEPGREEVTATGIATIADAGAGDITFLGNRRYLAALRTSKAAAVLVPGSFDEDVPPARIFVANPFVAFAAIAVRQMPPPIAYPPGVHPTAIVSGDASLGDGVSVQPYAIIEKGARIGRNSVIGAHVFVGQETTIGDNCLLYPNVCLRERVHIGNRVILHCGCVIGSDGYGYEFVAGRHQKIPQIGTVQIDDDVEIGACTTIDRARFGRTWIKEGAKIDNLVQIAHNVVIGRGCLIISQVGIAGSTQVGDFAILAGQVGVAGHLEIGEKAIIAAQAGVTKSLPGGLTYAGYPAAPTMKAHAAAVAVRRVPGLVKRLAALEAEVERLKGGRPETGADA